VLGAWIGLSVLLNRTIGRRYYSRCDDDRQDGIRRCRQWEDRGYSACTQYRDDGYNACSRYEDRGYNACAEWRKNCCDWWPCSWACEIISWFCVVWVWISNLVCVAWYWVSNLVCVAWVWISNLVCVAWYWVSYPVCLVTCLIRRAFAQNEVSVSRSECIYGWTQAYFIEERGCELRVVVRIRLQPDPGVTQQQIQNAIAVWEPAIEAAWTDRFRIRRTKGDCPCAEYRVSLDAQFVTSGEHHVVQVHAGSGRADMGNFFLNNTGGTTAHEVGHMLGNPDEYPDKACPSRTITNDNSIMRDSQNGTVRPRHYQGFAVWVSNRTCCDYSVVEG